MLWLLLNLNLISIVPAIFSVIPEGNLSMPRWEISEAILRRADGFQRNDKKHVTVASVVAWLTEKDHDFGEIRVGKPVNFAFKFKNTSTDTLLLQTVRTTCGCTAARYTEAPIAPGKEGEVAIEYDAAQSGTFSKKIRVFFDKQKKAEILWIRGEVIQK